MHEDIIPNSILGTSTGNRKSKIQDRKWVELAVIAFVLVVMGQVASGAAGNEV
jgi:hypothetical protein